MNTCKLPALKEKLRDLGLSTTGNKAELLSRLTNAGITIEHSDSRQESTPDDEYGETEASILENVLPQDAHCSAITEASDSMELRFLRREKELADREIELLKRELQLARSSPRTEVSERHRETLDWRNVKDMIADFNGSNDRDYDAWEKQIKRLVLDYGIDGHAAKAMLCSKLKDKALRWYHSRPDNVNLNFEDVLREMRKMFYQRQNKLQLRREFDMRTWQKSESFADYMHEKIMLANQVLNDNSEIVDYVIDGIPDANLRAQAHIQNFETPALLLERFSKISLREDTVTSRAGPSHRGTVAASHKKVKDHRKSSRDSDQSLIRCYNCNELGHFASDCNRPKRERGSCYRCGEQGHRAGQCTRKEDVNWVVQPPEDNVLRTLEFRFRKESQNYSVSVGSLMDSGSPISFIKQACVPLEFREVVSSRNPPFCGVNGSKLEIVGVSKVKVVVDGDEIDLNIYIVSNSTMSVSAVLGRDFLEAANFELIRNTGVREIMSIDVACTQVEPISQQVIVNEDLPENVKCKVRTLVNESYIQPPRPIRPKIETEMKIVVTDNKPFHSTPRRLSYTEKAELRKILDVQLKKGIIRESESEYASPIVLVKKKTGDTRMCIDFRTLNKITARDNYPLPLIEDQLDLLAGKKYFTALDLKDGFFHIKMALDSVKLTSFVTPLGQYECLKMPFGLKGAPLKFQRYVSEIFKSLIDSGDIAVYLDDFLIATTTLEHHFFVLEKVFRLLVENRLELRLDKCKFFQTKLEYLGYVITSDGIRPTDRGIDAVKRFPPPRSVKDVHSFLGLCSYFRKFVEQFSIIAKPLYDILRKNAVFRFGPQEAYAFEKLKERLIEAPILSIYSPRDETQLHCDASALGFGAILLQRKADRKFHPVFYFSRRTTDVESRYHSFELETLAIIYALRRFRTYLQGINFKIITDCQSLTLTLNKKDTNPRIARWTLELQNYDYVLEHRSGNKMTHVDALSRVNNVLVVEDNPFDRTLALKQSTDAEIVKLRDRLETAEDRFYEMRNGLVYRKKSERVLFYVPAELENSVIRKYHDEIGHVGLDKTVENIQRSYWFPQMRTKVENHIRNCLKCIAYAPVSGKAEGFLHSIPKGELPFVNVHIDHLGPISKASITSKCYVLVVIDAFTKFVKLYATKTTSTKEVIECLQKYFCAYSRPIRIISDRGSCFTSQEFTLFLEKNNVQHIKVATASPQANGQVERLNRSIVPMIAKLASEHKEPWHKFLPEVEYASNNTVCRSTGESPSVLLFGVHQRGKVVDGIREGLEANNIVRPPRNLIGGRASAYKQIKRIQGYNEVSYNKKRKPARRYKERDLVMIRNFVNTAGVSTKLIPKFKGPYEVIKVLRNDRYVIADIDGFQMTQTPYQGTWEAANMRPWSSVVNPSSG